MKNNIRGTTEKECSGCGACMQKCPASCIVMRENERGFLLPYINSEQCVSCGQCISVCPERTFTGKTDILEAGAGVVDNKELLKSSTSGGIFGLLAEAVLDASGIVFGCAWNDKMQTEHVAVTKKADLERIQKSKYVQSNTQNTFQAVEKALADNIPVLYSGTGCQIAGLYQYLGKGNELLVTVEVACHGVPAPGLFRKYIEWLEEKTRSNIREYIFRNKKKHKKGEHYTFCVADKNGKRKYFFSNEDPYYSAFIGEKTLRETCYHCKYKENGHVGDILLCDYWGIEKIHPQFDATYGASAIMLCTEKGMQLFDAVEKQKMVLCPTDYNSIIRYNTSLIKSAEVENKYDYSVNDSGIIEQLIPQFSLKRMIKNHVPESIKYGLIKRLQR